jgi:hypothetical protein
MYMSAPVFADGAVCGLSNKRKGQFVALDAPSHVLFLTNAGDLVIAKRNASAFAEERRIEIAAGETWAVPAFVPGGMVVRDAQGLSRLAWK